MTEITYTTNKMNAMVDPHLHIWSWDVAIYLFLGGLTAGILVIAALMVLRDKGTQRPFQFSTHRLVIFAPLLLSVGMFFLWLDLARKINVWRFYTTFRFTSPMSWGSWILLLVYPLSILIILATFRKGYPTAYNWLQSKWIMLPLTRRFPRALPRLFEYGESHRYTIARLTIPVGVALGIYTGILLSAFSARPFWNSGLLGPLFLVSGLSTAAALVILLSKDTEERHFFTRIDLGLIGVELSLLVLFMIGMSTSSQQHMLAIKLILGGPLTTYFWVFVVALGLLLPAFLKISELRGKPIPPAFGAILVLMGGLLLRVILVNAGQLFSWLGGMG